MMTLPRWLAGLGFATAGLLALIGATASQGKLAESSEFSRGTIDLGVVVSDLEKSAKFYSEAIGLTEAEGFTAPGEFAGDAGLTANKPLKIRVFSLTSEPTATKLKLMEVPGTPTGATEYIHSQTGFRYLTIFITDTTAAVARLEKAGVKPLAKGPVPLPKGFPEGVFLTCVRDPDGNIVELVGPKK